jgi:hypothetical protein
MSKNQFLSTPRQNIFMLIATTIVCTCLILFTPSIKTIGIAGIITVGLPLISNIFFLGLYFLIRKVSTKWAKLSTLLGVLSNLFYSVQFFFEG